MINVANKGGLVSGYFRATSQVVSSNLKPTVAPAAATATEWIVVQPPQEKLSGYSVGKIVPRGNIRVSSGPGGRICMMCNDLSLFFIKCFWLHNSYDPSTICPYGLDRS